MEHVDAALAGYGHVPLGARCLPLKDGSKAPVGGRGHLDAVPADVFVPLGNYGIALDGQWLLVDFDAEDALTDAWRAKLPPTWGQATPHGEHRLYAIPPGWKGKNRKIIAERDGTRRIIGDVKALGYLVGPGSVFPTCPNHPAGCSRARAAYIITDARAPERAPEWLLEFAKRDDPSEIDRLSGVERDRIAIGENDTELYSIAGFLRHKGFSEEFIARSLAGILNSGVVEQVPGNEYTAADVRRLAKSIAAKPVGDDLGEVVVPLQPESWINGNDVALVGPPIRWWVRGYVPQGELVMLYGKGGIGKSSWGSWLAAEVTQKGGSFGFVGVEEPFMRFLGRAVLGGAQRDRVFSIPNASTLQLPRDIPALRTALRGLKLSVLYLDSVYSHFSAPQGLNTAERARRCLGPLAEIAQETGTTIVGVFHENKAGDYLGSVEMVNVARYVLKAARPAHKPLRIDVDKTNIWDPQAAMTFEASERVYADPISGDVQLEEQADGTLRPLHTIVLARGADVNKEAIPADEIEDARMDDKVAKKPRKGSIEST